MAAGPNSFYAWLYRRWYLAFLLMGVSFLLFGITSLNLLQVFQAAWEFLRNHGVDAVREGVLWQMGELIASGYLAAGFFVLFKVCEKVLVDRVTCEKER